MNLPKVLPPEEEWDAIIKNFNDGHLWTHYAVWRIIDLADRLPEDTREQFLNDRGAFTIDLKTEDWKQLTARWQSFNNHNDKMVLFTRAFNGSELIAQCSCETVTMGNYKKLFDEYNIRGRARTPFLNAVKAVGIEQEHRGFFAGLDKMCRGLKTPEVA